jgi:hypothetical protein
VKSQLWAGSGAVMLATLLNPATATAAGNSLEAQFTATPIVIDGLVDDAWRLATPGHLTHAYDP